MQRIIHIFFFLTLIIGCKDKKNVNNTTIQSPDSLSLYFTKADNDTLSQNERIIFTKKALTLILKQKEDSLFIKNLFKVADHYYDMGEMELYKTTSLLIKQKVYQFHDSTNIARAYEYLGDYYQTKSINDSAYLYYTKAEKIYKQQKNNESLGRVYLNKAYLFYYQGDFLRAQIAVFEASTYFSATKNHEREQYIIYNLIGVLFSETKEYEEAINYHTKALNSARNSTIDNEYPFTANTLNNLGVAYRDLGKNREAISYYQKALQEKKLYEKSPSLYAILLDNLAYSQLQLKEYSKLPDAFYKALKIRDSLQIIPGIVINKIHLSEYYQDRKDTVRAVRFAKEAYTTAKEKGIDPNDILISLKQLQTANPSGATAYLEEYNFISDSLRRAEPLLPDKMIDAAHEAKDLAIQKAELEQRDKTRVIEFGIILFGVIVCFCVFYQRSKSKQARLKLESTQQKANEEIYELLSQQQTKIETGRQNEKSRIAKELHDGIINKLVSIRYNLHVLKNEPQTDAIKKSISYIDMIQDVEKEITAIAHDMNNSKFSKKNDYNELLKTLIESQKEISETEFILITDSYIQWNTVSNTIKMNLYRIIQESLQNIHKYAQAEKSTVSIFKDDNLLRVRIIDNGNGFNTEQQQKGMGLKNIQSRVKTLYGTLEIISKLKEGTSIQIVIPLSSESSDNT